MRNIRTNHQGFAAWNLGVSNSWTMLKWDFQHRKEPRNYPLYWKHRIWELCRGLILGWEFKNLRTEKQWKKHLNKRWN